MRHLGTREMRPTAMVLQLSGAHEDLASKLYRLGSDFSAE